MPDIRFDEDGYCNYCAAAIARLDRQLLRPADREQALEKLVETVKEEGKGKDYDCIIGVSGGVDSTTVAFLVNQLGLRALAVHFDNGWNTELAVDNITKTLQDLNIELVTHVVDWEEFKDLQLSFIKASVVNCEAPTDHGINALLYKTAHEHGTRFYLSGSNLTSETIDAMPYSHPNLDYRHLKALHRRFGSVPLKTMPTISSHRFLYYVMVSRFRAVPILNYIDYNKEEWKKRLTDSIGWRDYGGKHYESVWTRFFQGYFLPAKVNYDKRRSHNSSLICSGQLTREEALAPLEHPPYDEQLLEEDLSYVVKKFGLTKEEFQAYVTQPPKSADEYPTNPFYSPQMQRYQNFFRKIATSSS